MRRSAGLPALVVLAAVALAGCGGPPGLTGAEQTQLLGLIGKARTQAAAGNPTGAQTTLTALRARITRLRVTGELDPARAARMQSVAAQAQAAVRAQAAAAAAAAAAPAEPVVTPTVTTPAKPPKPAPAQTANPAQSIVQQANDLRNRIDQSVGKDTAKLQAKLDQLRARLVGGGGGPGNGNGNGNGNGHGHGDGGG